MCVSVCIALCMFSQVLSYHASAGEEETRALEVTAVNYNLFIYHFLIPFLSAKAFKTNHAIKPQHFFRNASAKDYYHRSIQTVIGSTVFQDKSSNLFYFIFLQKSISFSCLCF